MTEQQDHFQQIYATRAEDYQRMVAREDHAGNLLPALQRIHPLTAAVVAEWGAGTGRLSVLLAPLVQHLYAFDRALPMLRVAHRRLADMGTIPVTLAAADHRAVPLPTSIADVAIEGWAFGHFVGWYPNTWQAELARALAEMRRVLTPGGTMILIETLGTGREAPQPPTEGLAALYTHLEVHHGFEHTHIRTDYAFDSPEEADTLTRFFFGDELADSLGGAVVVPECTGIWWKQI